MSKAEKFIQDCTRNCSNIFEGYYPNGKQAYFPWLAPDQARKAVEIAREEMVEKVCSFIADNISEYIELIHVNPTIFIEMDGDRFVDDLKQAMKGE